MEADCSRNTRRFTHVFLPLLVAVLLLLPVPSQGAEDAEALYKTGVRLSLAKRWDEAAAAFRSAVEADPEHALSYANLGVALSRMNRHKQALLAFEAALQKGYDDPHLRYNRGISFAKVDLLEEAEAEMQKALKLNPRMVKADYDLGVIYLLQERFDAARSQVDVLYPRNEKLARKLFEKIPPQYKVVSVNDGGTVTGRVTMQGGQPRPRYFHLVHAPNIEFCTRMSDGMGHRLLFDFTVSESGGLKDTVIAIQGVARGKPFPSKMPSIHISRCHADPYVIGIRNGQNVMIENTDPIRHEIATYEKTKEGYIRQKSNKPVDKETSHVRNAFIEKDSDEFLIKCNLHPFLQTRGFLVDNPYFAISDAEGNFTLTDVPPGTYDVVAWHPFIPVQTGTVKVTAGGEATLDFTFNREDERRKLYHDDLKGYRFNTWFDSKEKFYGGPRIDDPVEVLQVYNGE